MRVVPSLTIAGTGACATDGGKFGEVRELDHAAHETIVA